LKVSHRVCIFCKVFWEVGNKTKLRREVNVLFILVNDKQRLTRGGDWVFRVPFSEVVFHSVLDGLLTSVFLDKKFVGFWIHVEGNVVNLIRKLLSVLGDNSKSRDSSFPSEDDILDFIFGKFLGELHLG
jgi:hypothetical protein